MWNTVKAGKRSATGIPGTGKSGTILEHPGAQTQVSPVYSPVDLILAMIPVSFLLAWQFVRVNVSWLLSVHAISYIPEVQLLDYTNCIALGAIICSVYVLMRQIAVAQTPLLNYVSEWVSSSEKIAEYDIRSVRTSLANAGNGPAIVVSVMHTLRDVDMKELSVGDYTTIIDGLSSKGLVEDRDFFLVRISEGWCSHSKTDRIVFECNERCLRTIGGIDIQIRYRTLIGQGLFEKQVFCIPRRWVRNASLLDMHDEQDSKDK